MVQYKNSLEHIGYAKALRKSASPAERILWKALSEQRKNFQIKFRRQHPIAPYVADFACISARLIIELDGLSHDYQKNYDKLRTTHLEQQGWQILRFTNDEVIRNVEAVVATIYKIVAESSPSLTLPAGGEGDLE